MCNLTRSTEPIPIPCTAIATEQDSPTSGSDKACAAEVFDEINTSVCGTIPSCTTRGAWSPPQGKPRLELFYITERRVIVPPSFNNLVIHFPKGLPVLPFSGEHSSSLAHPSPTSLNNNLKCNYSSRHMSEHQRYCISIKSIKVCIYSRLTITSMFSKRQ